MQWLLGVLQVIGHAVQAAFVAVVHALGIAARAIWIALKVVANASLTAIRAAARALEWLVTVGIPDALRAVGDALKTVGTFVRDVFGPILKWLKTLKSWLDWAWVNVVSKILAALDLAHLLLSGLSKLGVKWAGKLDAKLYELRTRIYSVWRGLTLKVNDLLTLMTLLVDPRGIFHRTPFLWSLAAYARQVSALLLSLGVKGLLPAAAGLSSGTQQAIAIDDFARGRQTGDTKAALEGFDALVDDGLR